MRLLAALLPVLVLSACGAAGGGVDGPCVHRYREPIITLDTDAATRLHVSDIRIDGQRVGRDQLLAEAQDGTRVRGRSLLCAVPCGFGESGGEWTFVVRAEGLETAVRTTAAYSEGGGNCPSWSDGGVHVELDLRGPAPAYDGR